MERVTRPPTWRPKLVWVVFLWFALSPGYTLISLLLIYSGAIAVRPEQAAYFGSLSAADYALMLVSASLNIAGAVLLLRLRRIAFYLFVASFVLTVSVTIVQALTTSFLAALGGPGALGALIGYGGMAAVCVYTWKLKARGVLA